MKKNYQTVNKYVNEHCQMDGNANYDHWKKQGDEGCSFFFTPNAMAPGSVVAYRKRGTAQQMSDGSFEFVAQKEHRAHSILIKKLAHGRLSETRDGAIQLTLKISFDEDIDMSRALIEEAVIAARALA